MPIHPTAIVSPKAELDSSVEVGPYAIIDDHVRIGAGTRVMARAYLTGHTTIGRDNQIHIGAVLGHEPQDLKFDRSCRSFLTIGDGNTFREYVTVHRGTAPDSATVIGNHCLLMANAHVGHNCVIGDRVIMANAVLLAGHVRVADRAFLSGGVVVHQFILIGRVAMLSGLSRISMDVPPFTTIAERNEVHGLNAVGLKRAGISAEAIRELKQLYRLIYRSDLSMPAALAQADAFTTPEAREFVEFIRQSPNGICQAERPLARTARTRSTTDSTPR
jgi:UDP-N-acetylglucosamine acyltransferase